MYIITINEKKILSMVLYNYNEDSIFLKRSKEIFSCLDIPINHYWYPNCHWTNKGALINKIIKEVINEIDYFIFFDGFCIPLNNQIYHWIYSKISDNNTLLGIADRTDNSLIELKPSVKPTGHIYAGMDFLAFSKNIYKKCIYPGFHETLRAAEGEEFSIRAAEFGFNITLMYPTSNFFVKDMSQSNILTFFPFNFFMKLGYAQIYNNIIFRVKYPRENDSYLSFIRFTELFLEQKRKQLKYLT